MYAALLLLGGLGTQAAVVDVEPTEFRRCTFAFDAHGHQAAKAGNLVCLLIEDGSSTPPRYEILLNLRVAEAESFVDGRILKTRVRVEVSPRQYRDLLVARKKGRILIVPPPPTGGGGVDPDAFNRRTP